MQPRIEYDKVAPDGVKTMWGLESYVRRCGLEPALLDLVKLRASQINGCAYCIDMHTKDARARGETEQRLYALNAWRETPYFTERERAALTWSEAVTEVTATHVPDEVYELARQPGGRGHQQLEPARDQLSQGARHVPACAPVGGAVRRPGRGASVSRCRECVRGSAAFSARIEEYPDTVFLGRLFVNSFQMNHGPNPPSKRAFAVRRSVTT